MKKTLVIPFLFTVLFSQLFPITHTNKTFMAIPTPHNYVAMKYTSWHRILKEGSTDANAWGGTFQVVPFYHTSINDGNLGKYFGTNYKNELEYGTPKELLDIQSGLIMHKAIGVPSLKGKLKLYPEHTTYGAYFSYHQELDSIHKGLFLAVNVPIMHVCNDLHASATNETKYLNKGILDFLSGNFQQTGNEGFTDLQEPLTHAKICGPQGRSGIADVELLLGYKFADKEEYELNGNLRLIAPTGNTPSGEYLLEALVGNGRHWGLGAGFNGALNVYKSDIHSIECLFNLNYLYLFKADEKRTLGYRNAIDIFDEGTEDLSVTMAWSHYILGGENGKRGTFPLANVLTRDASVTPGSQLQGHLSFAYHRNNTTVDFGYSLFAHEGDKVLVKNWTDKKYGPAHPDYNTVDVFNIVASESTPTVLGGSIAPCELDLNIPSTPAALKHSIHAAASYTLSERKNPLMLGCGFSVDWTQDNAIPIGYTLWAKAGITF